MLFRRGSFVGESNESLKPLIVPELAHPAWGSKHDHSSHALRDTWRCAHEQGTFEASLPSTSARMARAAAAAEFSLRAFLSAAMCRFCAGFSSATSRGAAPAALAMSWFGMLPDASARSASAASSAMRNVDLPACVRSLYMLLVIVPGAGRHLAAYLLGQRRQLSHAQCELFSLLCKFCASAAACPCIGSWKTHWLPFRPHVSATYQIALYGSVTRAQGMQNSSDVLQRAECGRDVGCTVGGLLQAADKDSQQPILVCTMLRIAR